MIYDQFQIKRIDMHEKKEREHVLKLLRENDLSYDLTLDTTIGVYDGKKIVATGSIKGNTLRCIAIQKEYQGGRVFNLLIDELIRIQFARGMQNLFIFTKPSAVKSFEFVGFSVVESVNNQVVLMENKPEGFKNYLDVLAKYKVAGDKIGAIVMNANPFTKGHLYLIEKASQESDHVHIFVVSSDLSSFPYKVRKKLIIEGTKHIKNITIHDGGDYIISNATFPSYFIKESSDIVCLHAALDLKIFAKYICPALNIKKRYVGKEPYCHVTDQYNQIMKNILPKFGVCVKEIPRKEINDEFISASTVRNYIKQGNMKKIKLFVPNSTYDFLISEEGKKVICKIQTRNQRH